MENPDHIKIELEHCSAKVSQPEYDLSPDEWHSRRTDAFAQLRKTISGIPREILDLVERFDERKLVELFVYRPSEKVELHFGVKLLTTEGSVENTKRLAEMIAAGKQILQEENKDALTASEALAFFFRMSLRELKQAEKIRRAAPVRTLGFVPRSLIAEIAMDLLASCETWGYPPGHFLNNLVRELLNLEHDRQGMSRDVETQERAATILAQNPTAGTRTLARILKVNASTISRWRRSSEFKRKVERAAETLKQIDIADEKLAAFVSKGAVQKESVALLLQPLTPVHVFAKSSARKVRRRRV